ncbi:MULTISPECIES: YueH family protein [unclassified Staphylococcus]|uniref:YueH family protein n=1 Tax=unclassified Staphylococcus TaxID=91994 RepID=UPI0021D3817D|nr:MULTISPECIES: YueH family protein [unclassified Staphylococcus]UXR70136.1 YueH family protein [Staphylococcus sp. IVB6246]UXR72195.1 YueH family protein [Staphylococcus sp. IVB6240]UXR74504.1 YueH family protein [Staphylococcus sp. IVB6238]UXR76888.1 YueH family protein [Staphylococcus sp. IVB6233]UXR81014.1 YueH family protein [Staphylococcus sp. IVB6218]
MKIRESHSENYSAKVFIYENKKEDYFVVAVPDLNWSMMIDDQLFGEALTEHIVMHLFNVLDEQEAEVLALRITQWVQET